MTNHRAPKEAKQDSTRRTELPVQDEGIQTPQLSLSRLNPANVLRLQRTVGNQVAQRLLKSPRPFQRQEADEDAPTTQEEGGKPQLNTQVVDISDKIEQEIVSDSQAAPIVEQIKAAENGSSATTTNESTETTSEQQSDSQQPDAEKSAADDFEFFPIQRKPMHMGNRSFAPTLQRDGPDPAPGGTSGSPARRINLAFVMGKDRRGSSNRFYTAAMIFFATNVPDVRLINHDRIRSLEAVFEALRYFNQPVGKLYIITHANQQGEMMFPLRNSDEERRLNYAELDNALIEAPQLFQLPAGIVDRHTTVEIKGCNIGRSSKMLDALDQAFGNGAGTVVAPTHKQSYRWQQRRDGTVVATESFGPYFIEFPGRVSKSRSELRAAFKAKYDQLSLTDRQWNKVFQRGIKRHAERLHPDIYNSYIAPTSEARALYVGRQILKQVRELRQYRPNRLVSHEANPHGVDHAVYGGKATTDGIRHVYTVADRRGREEKFYIDEPTDDDLMKGNLETSMGRPEAYEMDLRRYRANGRLKIEVVMKRTEYTIHGEVQGSNLQNFLPPESDTDFYGESTVEPPTPTVDDQQGAGAGTGP